MFEQLSEVLAGDLLVERFKSEPQLKSIQSAIADEVVNPVIIDTPQISPIEFNLDTVQKSLSSPEPLLSQLGLKSVLSSSFFNRIDGTPLNDFILGTAGEDLIFAKEGDDIVIGLAGNDIVFGEDGDDIIFGGPTSPGVPDDDIVFGGNGNDTFYGGEGDDLIVGGPGKDTVDYRFLNEGITLEAVGVIDKGSAGVDQIFELETIIGNASQINSIDASTGNGNASIEADLSRDRLSIIGTPAGNFNFTIENFVDVVGTNKDDIITGNKAANNITGGKGNDELSGLAGKDTINGVDSTSKLAGFGEVDILTGGADRDVFVLGDKKQAYYVGNGSKDLAVITDFKTGSDTIQLNGSLRDYLFLGNTSSTSILRRSFIVSDEVVEIQSLTEPSSSIVSDEILETESLTKPPISFDLIGTVTSSINTTTDLVFV